MNIVIKYNLTFIDILFSLVLHWATCSCLNILEKEGNVCSMDTEHLFCIKLWWMRSVGNVKMSGWQYIYGTTFTTINILPRIYLHLLFCSLLTKLFFFFVFVQIIEKFSQFRKSGNYVNLLKLLFAKAVFAC